MSKFKVGDDVFSLGAGWGKVIEICEHDTYPIQCDFDGNDESFDLDGREIDSNFAPSLFTVEEAKIKFPEYRCPAQMKKGYLVVAKAIADMNFIAEKPSYDPNTEYLFEVEIEK